VIIESNKPMKKTYGILLIALSVFAAPAFAQLVLQPKTYEHYINAFNTDDEELYPQYISNAESWAFLSKNIPLFDCPDSTMEQTYYFRWWTFRKHIRKTPEGFVILEFLPDVNWAGKYNTISCAAAPHIYEGRWLHDQRYINDYIQFWFKGGGHLRSYSNWVTDAAYNQYLTTGNAELIKRLLPDFIQNYLAWEKEKRDSTGLFWQQDNRDGMEISICGSQSADATGYRATINSYMYAEASAISEIAKLTGQTQLSLNYRHKAVRLKSLLLQTLWDAKAQFFKVIPRNGTMQLCSARELHGYTPWYFNIPDNSYAVAWKFLMDSTYFYAPYGPTTAEQDHPDFQISYKDHECQWNGPSWPFSTAITLTAMANVLNHDQQSYINKADYYKLLSTYAKSQRRTLENGKQVPWIDENLNPYTGDWIARTRLKNWPNGAWPANNGGKERGKDYNHSTFCDLIITGLVGLRPSAGNRVTVNPLVPSTWQYFCLDNISYHGRQLTILYDKTGQRYRKGIGFMLFENGKKVASSKSLTQLSYQMAS